MKLIGATTTKTGFKVKAVVDTNTYAKGIKKDDEEMAALNLKRAAFHGEWNYELHPRYLHSLFCNSFFLGDGASWIWELARSYFPEAT